MALALKPAPAPHRDLTGGLGVDRIGMVWINAVNAAEAAYQASENGDGWRVVDWGDGVSATGSVLGTHGFTNGVGYVTAGGNWAAQLGGSNSFSNTLAWFTIGEIVDGVATGRQITVQRGSGSGSGGERPLNIMETPTACTGVATATAPRSTGGTQRFVYGTAFGAVGTSFVSTGANWFAASDTICTIPWVAEKAVNGRVGFGFAMWGSSAATYESGFLTLPLSQAADSDPYPWVTFCGLWAAVFGGTPAYTVAPTTFSANSVNGHALDASGTWRFAAGNIYQLADGVTRPGLIATTVLADKDGDFWLMPVFISLDNVTGSQPEPKGQVCDALKLALVANSTHRFPTTLHSSVLDATEPARVLLGQVAITGEVGYVPTWTSSANQTTWKSFGNDPTDGVSDSTPPTTTLISPVSLTEISRTDPIVLELDDDTGIELFVIFCVYPTLGMVEVVIDGGDLDLETSYTITPSTVDGKQRYSVLRTGGWPAPGYLRSRLIDARGNQS